MKTLVECHVKFSLRTKTSYECSKDDNTWV